MIPLLGPKSRFGWGRRWRVGAATRPGGGFMVAEVEGRFDVRGLGIDGLGWLG